MKKLAYDSVLLIALGSCLLLLLLNSILAYQYFQEPYQPALVQLQKSTAYAGKISLVAQLNLHQPSSQTYLNELVILQDSLKNSLTFLESSNSHSRQYDAFLKVAKQDKTLSSLLQEIKNASAESAKYVQLLSRNVQFTDEASRVETLHTRKKLLKELEEIIILLKKTEVHLLALQHTQQKQYKTAFWIFSALLGVVLLGVAGWFYENNLKQIQKLAQTAPALLQSQATVQALQLDAVQQPELYQLATLLAQTGKQLQEAAQFAHAIGQGNFNYQLSYTQENTLARALQDMQYKLQEIAQEEKIRNWHISGLAELNELLRVKQQESLGQFAYHFTVFLVKYTQSVQGSLYLLKQQQDRPVLELMACYAFDRQRFIKDQKPIDEGVLGQVFMSRQLLVIEQVPANYLKITSGLGQAPPQALLVVPIIDNETVFGVMEIAAFKPFEQARIAFAQAACQALATTLAIIERNEKNAALLAKAEQDSQALRAQEEELRQNAEEMQAIQEELNRRYQALQEETNLNKCIIDAINKTNAAVELDLQGNILEVNNMYLSVMGYDRDEIIGSNEIKYVPEDEKQSQRYQIMWESLRNGSYHSGEYRRIAKDGKEVWLNGTYNPIFDIHGKVYKIIQFAQFTTEEKERELDLTSKINALSTTFPLVDIALDGTLLSANHSFLNALHFKRADIRAKKFSDFLVEHQAEFQHAFQEAINGKLQQLIITIQDAQQRHKYFISVISPIRNLAGNIYKLMTILIDITEQKELELELLHKQQQLSGTIQELENAQKDLNEQKIELETRINLLSKTAIIFEMNAEGVITQASNEFAQFLGFKAEQLLHKSTFELLEQDAKATLLDMLQTARNGFGLTVRNTLCYHTQDKQLKWGDTTIASVITPDGKVNRMIAVMFDVTQQVLQETALRNSLAAERMKNASLFKNSSVEKTKIERILEELLSQDTAEGELNINAVINNDTIPTAVLNKQGVIVQHNALFETQIKQKQLLQQDIFNYISFGNIAEKILFKEKLLQGDMIETTVQLTYNPQSTTELLTLPMFNTAGELEILVMLLS